MASNNPCLLCGGGRYRIPSEFGSGFGRVRFVCVNEKQKEPGRVGVGFWVLSEETVEFEVLCFVP